MYIYIWEAQKMKIYLKQINMLFFLIEEKIFSSIDNLSVADHFFYWQAEHVMRGICKNPSLFADATFRANFRNELVADKLAIEAASPYNGLLNFSPYILASFFYPRPTESSRAVFLLTCFIEPCIIVRPMRNIAKNMFSFTFVSLGLTQVLKRTRGFKSRIHSIHELR